MFRYLGKALATAALACTMSPALALEWPMNVAAAGCQIEWRGPDGYYELATSKGTDAFPTIRFSRQDWGTGIYPFVPLCGGACQHGAGRDALHRLFPLKVGKKITFSTGAEQTTLHVKKRERVAPLNHDAFLVQTTDTSGAKFQSWWAPKLGWIVAYKDRSFYKVVTAFSCHKGLS